MLTCPNEIPNQVWCSCRPAFASADRSVERFTAWLQKWNLLRPLSISWYQLNISFYKSARLVFNSTCIAEKIELLLETKYHQYRKLKLGLLEMSKGTDRHRVQTLLVGLQSLEALCKLITLCSWYFLSSQPEATQWLNSQWCKVPGKEMVCLCRSPRVHNGCQVTSLKWQGL